MIIKRNAMFLMLAVVFLGGSVSASAKTLQCSSYEDDGNVNPDVALEITIRDYETATPRINILKKKENKDYEFAKSVVATGTLPKNRNYFVDLKALDKKKFGEESILDQKFNELSSLGLEIFKSFKADIDPIAGISEEQLIWFYGELRLRLDDDNPHKKVEQALVCAPVGG